LFDFVEIDGEICWGGGVVGGLGRVVFVGFLVFGGKMVVGFVGRFGGVRGVVMGM